MSSYFTDSEDALTYVMHLDQGSKDQPLVRCKMKFNEMKNFWIHFFNPVNEQMGKKSTKILL